jgi:ABC-type uncharacterized transport system fused permease/ATPase subunit
MNINQAVGANLIAPIPGLAGRMSGNLSFEGFLMSHGLAAAFINKLYFVFNAIPEFSRMATSAKQIKEMAVMIDKVQDKQTFYRLSGVHDFEETILDDDDDSLIRLRDLRLLHRGKKDNPFIKSEGEISFKPGDWTYIHGKFGAGKTSLLKALAGLWPYGSGEIAMKNDTRTFYARQTPDITGRRSLIDHVLYGTPGDETDQDRIYTALEAAGLGKFIDRANEKTNGGKPWQETLSGGEKQCLVLARLLYQKPDVILLDEATKSLNPEAQTEFFATIRRHLPQACVIAIVHEEKTPTQTDGTPFFNKIITVDDGTARLESIHATAQTAPRARHPAQSLSVH